MKKIFSILALCASFFLVACSDDDNSPASGSLQVVSTDIDFLAAGGEGTIVVNAAGAVDAVSNKDWCVATAEGTTVRVSVSPSDEPTSRSALITISSAGEVVEVPVVQGGAILVMDEYDLSHSVTYAGGTVVIPFKTTSAYAVNIPEAAQGWLTYEVTDSEIVFTVPKNDTRTPRGADVTITAGKKSVSLNISQAEVSAEEIAGTWNASFTETSSGRLISGIPIDLIEAEPGVYVFNVGQILGAALDGYIYLAFEDNALTYYAGMEVMDGYRGQYTVVAGMGNVDGELYAGGTFTAVPLVKDGKLTYRFAYSNNEANGYPNINSICLLAFSGSSYAGLVYEFLDFTLTQP